MVPGNEGAGVWCVNLELTLAHVRGPSTQLAGVCVMPGNRHQSLLVERPWVGEDGRKHVLHPTLLKDTLNED